MAEEEIQKRNTDCVYFLASPLTCKKGSDCEYRHSETARLNPRDCWYWLNRSCRNPSCAFRHPPLEGSTDTQPEAAHLPSVIPTTKSSVPCYFYFNAYCIKGDQCPFLHDTLPAQKIPMSAPIETTATSSHLPNNKASTGSDTGPASVEMPANPLGGNNFDLAKQKTFEVIIKQGPPTGVGLEEPSPSIESSIPECEEPTIKSPPTEYVNGNPEIGPDPDQGSDEIVNECAEPDPDEWWESSPGFDVLVDDGSEQAAYEEDADYILAPERESEMLHRSLLQYEYELPSGYNPSGYADAEYLYEHGVRDGYDHAEPEYTPDHIHQVSEHLRERRNHEPAALHRKRRPKLSRRRQEVVDGRESGDLRDRLRIKRRRTDGSSHKNLLSRSRGRSLDRFGMGPLPRGRVVSEERMMNFHVLSQSEAAPALHDDSYKGRGWSGYPNSIRHAQSRLRERENRRRNRKPVPTIASEVSQGFSYSNRAESSHIAAATFDGPKTLAQIKEEKGRAMAVDGNNSSGTRPLQDPRRRSGGSRDFEGPKPLNEILKDKRRSSMNGNTNGLASGKDSEQRLEKQNNEYESDSVDEDYYSDEDALREKLVRIISS